MITASPASVSVAYGVGGDWRVEEAKHEANAQFMRNMESLICARVHTDGTTEQRTTATMVASTIFDPYSRGVAGKVAPCVHHHNAVFNATLDGDTWKAVDFGLLFRWLPALQAAYCVDTAKSVERIGYNVLWTDRRWEIDIDPQIIPLFALRTQQIERAAFDRCIWSDREKARLGATLREGKAAPMDRAWARTLWRTWLSHEQLARLDGVVLEAQTRIHPTRQARVNIGEAAEIGFRRLGTRLAAWSTVDCVAEILYAGRGDVSLAEARQFVTNSDLPGLVRTASRRSSYFTSITTLTELEECISLVQAGKGVALPLGKLSLSGRVLTDVQAAALDMLAQSTDRVVSITASGVAARHMRRELGARSDMQIIGVRESHVRLLQKDGVSNAVSVEDLLAAKPALRKETLLWVEEASYLAAARLSQLLRFANDRAIRVVLVEGDTYRSSVNRGNAVRHVADLTQIRLTPNRPGASCGRTKRIRGEEHGYSDSGARLDAAAARCLSLRALHGACAVTTDDTARAELTDAIRTAFHGDRDRDSILWRVSGSTLEPGQHTSLASDDGIEPVDENCRYSLAEAERRGLLRRDGNRCLALSRIRIVRQLEIKCGDFLRVTETELYRDNLLVANSIINVAGVAPDGSLILRDRRRLPPGFQHLDYGWVTTPTHETKATGRPLVVYIPDGVPADRLAAVKGLIHTARHTCVYSPNGEQLISDRTPEPFKSPLWDLHLSHMLQPEPSLNTSREPADVPENEPPSRVGEARINVDSDGLDEPARSTTEASHRHEMFSDSRGFHEPTPEVPAIRENDLDGPVSGLTEAHTYSQAIFDPASPDLPRAPRSAEAIASKTRPIAQDSQPENANTAETTEVLSPTTPVSEMVNVRVLPEPFPETSDDVTGTNDGVNKTAPDARDVRRVPSVAPDEYEVSEKRGTNNKDSPCGVGETHPKSQAIPVALGKPSSDTGVPDIIEMIRAAISAQSNATEKLQAQDSHDSEAIVIPPERCDSSLKAPDAPPLPPRPSEVTHPALPIVSWASSKLDALKARLSARQQRRQVARTDAAADQPMHVRRSGHTFVAPPDVLARPFWLKPTDEISISGDGGWKRAASIPQLTLYFERQRNCYAVERAAATEVAVPAPQPMSNATGESGIADHTKRDHFIGGYFFVHADRGWKVPVSALSDPNLLSGDVMVSLTETGPRGPANQFRVFAPYFLKQAQWRDEAAGRSDVPPPSVKLPDKPRPGPGFDI